MTTTPPPKRRTRRLLQFSLRSLLVFVLLVSVGMSWLGVKMARARRQREAVRMIEELGSSVYYDYQSVDWFAEPPIPKWACALFGDDFFFDVVEAWCGVDFGDEEASHLEVLTTLTRLDLGGTQVTDAGLEHLDGLTNLEILNLEDTQITDAGLEHLKGLTALAHLALSCAHITDTGLGHLKGLPNLHYLDLRYLDPEYTQVTPEGVKKLQRALPECEIVYSE